MTHVLDNARVEVFPSFIGTEDGCSPQEWSVNRFNNRPSHELTRHKAFDEVAVSELVSRCA